MWADTNPYFQACMYANEILGDAASRRFPDLLRFADNYDLAYLRRLVDSWVPSVQTVAPVVPDWRVGMTWGVSFNGCDAEYQTKRAASAPVAFPSVTVSSGGSVAVGTYLLKYTWQRQVTNNSTPAESLPSPESSPVVVTSGHQTISFTIPAAPTDVLYVNYANIYLTNGATGTETFLGKITLNTGAPTTVTYSTPIAGDGVTFPPLTSAIGHMYVVQDSNNISINGSTCNTVPNTSTDPRFLLVVGNSYQVSARQCRMIQQLSPPPAYYIEIDAAPPYGGSGPDQIFIESGDITAANVSVGTGVNHLTLNLSGVLTLPNLNLGNGNCGALTVSAGQTTREHDYAFAYANPPVVLITPLSDPGVRYWVVVSGGSFTVTLASALGSDLVFNYAVLGNPN